MYTLIATVALTYVVHSVRYVIDNDNDLGQYFALPLDVCIKASAFDTRYIKYNCKESNKAVEKRIYDDAECTTANDVDAFGPDDKSPCDGPKFSCEGDDPYLTVGFYFKHCDTHLTDFPVSLGCYCDSATTSYTASCLGSVANEEPLSGSINRFTDTECNTPSVNGTQDISECYYLAHINSLEINGRLSDCVPEEIVPTSAPTLPSEIKQRKEKLKSLGNVYKFVLGGFVLVFGVIVLLAWLDAWYVRTNDYFSIGALSQMVFQTIDMMSDCFFTAELFVQFRTSDKFAFQIMFYLSVVFIVLPGMTALFQLYFYTKKHWLDNDHVRAWLSTYSAFLLVLSIFTGSSFSAVALLNSFIFQLELFDMGLTYKQLRAFNTRRIWSVVALENMPQLFLQSGYFVVQGGDIFDYPITLSSMVFSVVSIIISLMSLTMEKTINKTQRSIIISMDVTGDCVESGSSKCRTMNYKLRKALAPVLGVDFAVIEIVKPMYVSGGLALDIIVYVNDNRRAATVEDYGKMLKEANESGKLPKLISESWKLKGLPSVLHIRYALNQSSQDRKNTIRDQKEMVKMGTDSLFQNDYAKANVQSVSSKERVPTVDESVNGNGRPPPPTFNPNAKAVTNGRTNTKTEVEIEMEGGADEGGEGGNGDSENAALIENLVRMGYENTGLNRIALQKSGNDINAAVQYLKNNKQKKVGFVQVQKDTKEMPPPPRFNPNARKASRAQRKQSEAQSPKTVS